MKASTTFQQKLGNVSKLNRPIPSSAVGAGIACPKTQSQLFSDERTSSPRIKRQHYPRFDTASCATLAAPEKGIKTDKGNLMIRCRRFTHSTIYERRDNKKQQVQEPQHKLKK